MPTPEIALTDTALDDADKRGPVEVETAFAYALTTQVLSPSATANPTLAVITQPALAACAPVSSPADGSPNGA